MSCPTAVLVCAALDPAGMALNTRVQRCPPTSRPALACPPMKTSTRSLGPSPRSNTIHLSANLPCPLCVPAARPARRPIGHLEPALAGSLSESPANRRDPRYRRNRARQLALLGRRNEERRRSNQASCGGSPAHARNRSPLTSPSPLPATVGNLAFQPCQRSGPGHIEHPQPGGLSGQRAGRFSGTG